GRTWLRLLGRATSLSTRLSDPTFLSPCAPSLYRLSGFRLLRRVPLAAGMLGFGDRGIGPGQLARCWLRASQPLIMSFAERRSRAAVAWWRLSLRLRRRRSLAGGKNPFTNGRLSH